MPTDEGGAPRDRLGSVLVAALPLAIGGIGSVFTARSLKLWYRTLDKPDWNPPAQVFGPVWTTLYLAMGVALLQVYRLDRQRTAVRVALVLFAIQLALNLLWSYLFFGRRSTGAALVDILALDATALATTVAFGRLKTSAGALLVPYLAWLAFATLLNADIHRRNA